MIRPADVALYLTSVLIALAPLFWWAGVSAREVALGVGYWIVVWVLALVFSYIGRTHA